MTSRPPTLSRRDSLQAQINAYGELVHTLETQREKWQAQGVMEGDDASQHLLASARHELDVRLIELTDVLSANPEAGDAGPSTLPKVKKGTRTKGKKTAPSTMSRRLRSTAKAASSSPADGALSPGRLGDRSPSPGRLTIVTDSESEEPAADDSCRSTPGVLPPIPEEEAPEFPETSRPARGEDLSDATLGLTPHDARPRNVTRDAVTRDADDAAGVRDANQLTRSDAGQLAEMDDEPQQEEATPRGQHDDTVPRAQRQGGGLDDDLSSSRPSTSRPMTTTPRGQHDDTLPRAQRQGGGLDDDLSSSRPSTSRPMTTTPRGQHDDTLPRAQRQGGGLDDDLSSSRPSTSRPMTTTPRGQHDDTLPRARRQGGELDDDLSSSRPAASRPMTTTPRGQHDDTLPRARRQGGELDDDLSSSRPAASPPVTTTPRGQHDDALPRAQHQGEPNDDLSSARPSTSRPFPTRVQHDEPLPPRARHQPHTIPSRPTSVSHSHPSSTSRNTALVSRVECDDALSRDQGQVQGFDDEPLPPRDTTTDCASIVPRAVHDDVPARGRSRQRVLDDERSLPRRSKGIDDDVVPMEVEEEEVRPRTPGFTFGESDGYETELDYEELPEFSPSRREEEVSPPPTPGRSMDVSSPPPTPVKNVASVVCIPPKTGRKSRREARDEPRRKRRSRSPPRRRSRGREPASNARKTTPTSSPRTSSSHRRSCSAVGARGSEKKYPSKSSYGGKGAARDRPSTQPPEKREATRRLPASLSPPRRPMVEDLRHKLQGKKVRDERRVIWANEGPHAPKKVKEQPRRDERTACRASLVDDDGRRAGKPSHRSSSEGSAYSSDDEEREACYSSSEEEARAQPQKKRSTDSLRSLDDEREEDGGTSRSRRRRSANRSLSPSPLPRRRRRVVPGKTYDDSSDVSDAGEDVDEDGRDAPKTNDASEPATSVAQTMAVQMELTRTMCRSMESMASSLRAPPVTLREFTGNPRDYHAFMTEYADNVERYVPDDGGRLTRLIQACRGSTAGLLAGCREKDPTEGLKEAKRILHNEYGRKTTVLAAWTDHLTKSYPSLEELSSQLQAGTSALEAIGALADASGRSDLERIAARFPDQLHSKWRKAVRKARDDDTFPSLKKLAQLVKDYVSDAKEAAKYGRSRDGGRRRSPVKDSRTSPRRSPRRRTSPRRSPRRRVVLKAKRAEDRAPLTATAALSQPLAKVLAITDGETKCQQCQEDHALPACEIFKKLPVAQRRRTALHGRLCFACLLPGHRVSDCPAPTPCDQCPGKHHPLLHDGFRTKPSTPGSKRPRSEGDSTRGSSTNKQPRRQTTKTGSARV